MFKFFARIGYTIVSIIQGLIVLRFSIILLSVSTNNSIVKWIMETSEIFVNPFVGILESSTLKLGTLIVDLNSIVAFFFYLILGFVTIEIVKAFSSD